MIKLGEFLPGLLRAPLRGLPSKRPALPGVI